MTQKNNRSIKCQPAGGCDEKTRNTTAKILERLTSEESETLLHMLIKKHPEIRSEAEQLAKDLVDSTTIEDVVGEVLFHIGQLDIDSLNERAGAHSWGYVEPSEAARELLEESVQDLIDDMKRRGELGLATAAETICSGIVLGLYKVKDTNSDGALGWDPDFPADHAGFVVTELFESCQALAGASERERICNLLAAKTPKWREMFERIAKLTSSE